MRRGRGKGKRQNASTREDHHGSGEEEKIPAYKRRGRPQKPVKDETEGEEEMVEEKDNDTNGSETSKEDVTENGRKRKTPLESKESNVTEEENGLGSKSSTDDSVKSSLSLGFRQIGSRRKNKPRRAAEAVVECHGV